jgi:hypothetical protein
MKTILFGDDLYRNLNLNAYVYTPTSLP